MGVKDEIAIGALARALVRTGMYVDAGIDTTARLDNPRTYAAALLADPDLAADGLHFVMIETLERAALASAPDEGPLLGFVNSDPNRPLDQEPRLAAPAPDEVRSDLRARFADLSRYYHDSEDHGGTWEACEWRPCANDHAALAASAPEERADVVEHNRRVREEGRCDGTCAASAPDEGPQPEEHHSHIWLDGELLLNGCGLPHPSVEEVERERETSYSHGYHDGFMAARPATTPAALDVERLARALEADWSPAWYEVPHIEGGGEAGWNKRRLAEIIAREYAALRPRGADR